MLCVILAVFFYRGQPRPCPICRSDGHRASSAICVKCRCCLQPGHFARDCKSATPESDPSFVPDDVSAADDDDHIQSEESMSEEFANGDEGGVEAASAPTIPAVPFSSSVFFCVPSSVDKEPAAAASVASSAAPVPPNVPPDDIASRVKRCVKSVSTSIF